MLWVQPLLSDYNQCFIAAGAAHEMMRIDRELFVKIVEENLQPGSEKNFEKRNRKSYSTRNTPFDFESITMYGPTDFGVEDVGGGRRTTIEPLRPEDNIR